MAEFKNEDIKGYVFGEEYVCLDCIEDEEEADVSQDELITDNHEDSQIFCDRCGKRIV